MELAHTDRKRQHFDLRPWHDAGEEALQRTHVRQTLEQLHASVRERVDRGERSRNSPNNLIKHNPAFVGKTVRVFISSTFRDMHAERDYLVRFVFPRLREKLLQRRIHLVDVDLR